MSKEKYLKKQIVYPSLIARMITQLIDLTIIIFLSFSILQQANFYIFKYNFDDYLISHDMKFEKIEDMDVVIRTESFVEYITPEKFIKYYIELMLMQFFVMSFYYIFFWTKFGFTPGKYFFKMKLVDYDSFKKPSLIQSIIRYLMYVFIPVSIVTILFTKEGRGLHDYFSRTVVLMS